VILCHESRSCPPALQIREQEQQSLIGGHLSLLALNFWLALQMLSHAFHRSCTGRKFVEDSLASLCEHGAKIVRLDAFGYATKKPGTRCFFEVQNFVAASNCVCTSTLQSGWR
jgi:hypothetical protein